MHSSRQDHVEVCCRDIDSELIPSLRFTVNLQFRRFGMSERNGEKADGGPKHLDRNVLYQV